MDYGDDPPDYCRGCEEWRKHAKDAEAKGYLRALKDVKKKLLPQDLYSDYRTPLDIQNALEALKEKVKP
jgi:hypothetical protein